MTDTPCTNGLLYKVFCPTTRQFVQKACSVSIQRKRPDTALWGQLTSQLCLTSQSTFDVYMWLQIMGVREFYFSVATDNFKITDQLTMKISATGPVRVESISHLWLPIINEFICWALLINIEQLDCLFKNLWRTQIDKKFCITSYCY